MRGIDVLAFDEGHLDVHLEPRLPVGAEILIAIAARQLEITLDATDHQDLFELLRRLGQRVKVPGSRRLGTRNSRAPSQA